MTPKTTSASVFPVTWGIPRSSRVMVTPRARASQAATSGGAGVRGAQAAPARARRSASFFMVLSLVELKPGVMPRPDGNYGTPPRRASRGRCDRDSLPACLHAPRHPRDAMRHVLTLGLLPFLLAACGRSGPGASPAAMVLPDSVTILEAGSGAQLSVGDLLGRMSKADFVLLGELHDNPVHHQVRGSLIRAAARKPAVVFEQFQASPGPIALPAAGETREAWLDAHGFDRNGWRWPLHQPVVDAAIASGRAIWGSGVSREDLRSVVRGGESAAPAELQPIMAAAPLGDAARAAIDSDLVAGHCGQLPEQMIPGMRAAQVVRDASMTRALLSA